MSEQIKKWCDAIMFHEDNLDLGTCKTLKMITDEARRLTAEIERLQKRDSNATIILCETTDTIPFHQERMKIIDFGVSDNIYMVERASEI